MTSKTDLNAANLPQLYDAHKIIDQFKIDAESKDPMTKTTWHLPAALWFLLMLVISTRDKRSLSPTGQLIISENQAMNSIAHVDIITCNSDRLSQKQYSRPAHRQLLLNERQRRKTRSGATMARGPLLFSPPVKDFLWSCQGNSNTKLLAQPIYLAESMERDGWLKGFILHQQYYCTSNVTNSPSQGFYKLSKATNELPDAFGLGRHVSRRGLFGRLIDAYPPMELAIPQDPPQVAMADATTPTPRPQGARMENSDPHYPAHNAKAEPDYLKFMKDIKSELGALHTAFGKMEALLNRKLKPKDCKDKQAKAHAAIAHGKNHKAQKGATASSVTQLLPSYYANSSGMEKREMVLFANHALACDHFSNVFHAAPIPGPFHRTVVRSARPKQSLRDYFGLSAQRFFNKKRGETSMAATTTAFSATSHQPSYVELIEELDIDARALADFEEPCLPGEVMVSTMPLELLLAGAGTINAAPSRIPDEEVPELVSTSSDEDDADRLRALPSLAAAGVKLSTAPSYQIRTRRMAFMASFHYPDAIVCRGMDADGSVAVTKTTTTLYEHALEDVSDPHTSSRASRKAGNFGKKNGTPTMVSTRSLRSGVMNQIATSRNDSPFRRRRPSFNTTTSPDRSPRATSNVPEDDHLEDDVGAALTTLASGRGMCRATPSA
jgi:hypothetical protein